MACARRRLTEPRRPVCFFFCATARLHRLADCVCVCVFFPTARHLQHALLCMSFGECFAPVFFISPFEMTDSMPTVMQRHKETWKARDARIRFDEFAETYAIDGETEGVARCTELLSQFFTPFDPRAFVESLTLEQREKRYGSERVEDCLKAMQRKTDLGTNLHAAIEAYYDPDKRYTPTPPGMPDARAQPEWQLFLEFDQQYIRAGGWVIARTEWTVFDERLRIGGTIDALFYHAQRRTFMLVDWKRALRFVHSKWNQNALTRNWFRSPLPSAKGVCHELHDTAVEKYGLQLCVYWEILQRNYPGVPVERAWLVRMHPDTPTDRSFPQLVNNRRAEVVEVLDQRDLVRQIFDARFESTRQQKITAYL